MTASDRPRAWGSSLPARSAPMGRGAWLSRSRQPAPGDASSLPLRARKPIRQVSARRARDNRTRAAMADRRWPDRRDGTVKCIVPWCPLPADDLHEILPRGRGGSITDEENTVPTCRGHNGELTKSPEWGYRLGLLKHDGLCCRGRDVCARYAEGGAA